MQSDLYSKQIPMIQREIVYINAYAMHQNSCQFTLLLQDVQLMNNDF